MPDDHSQLNDMKELDLGGRLPAESVQEDGSPLRQRSRMRTLRERHPDNGAESGREPAWHATGSMWPTEDEILGRAAPRESAGSVSPDQSASGWSIADWPDSPWQRPARHVRGQGFDDPGSRWQGHMTVEDAIRQSWMSGGAGANAGASADDDGTGADYGTGASYGTGADYGTGANDGAGWTGQAIEPTSPKWPKANWDFTGMLPPDSTDDALEAMIVPPGKRKRRRWPIAIAALLVLILAVGAAWYYMLYTEAQKNEGLRTEAYATLNEAIKQLQGCDVVIVEMSKAIDGNVTNADIYTLQTLVDKVPECLTRLESAEGLADDAEKVLAEGSDAELVANVKEAIKHRKSMLNDGRTIINTDISALNCLVAFKDAWALILSADESKRQAADLSNQGGATRLQNAIGKIQVAADQLDQARERLNAAREALPIANFGVLDHYLDLNKESLALAIEADRASIEGKTNTAKQITEQFNEKETELGEATRLIPPEPTTLVTDAYNQTVAKTLESYLVARDSAAQADAYIRDYLGVETQATAQ